MAASAKLTIGGMFLAAGLAMTGGACRDAMPGETAPSSPTVMPDAGAAPRVTATATARAPATATATDGGLPTAEGASSDAAAAPVVTPAFSIKRRPPCWVATVEGLPAITTDGRYVAVVEANDTGGPCEDRRLLVYDTTSGQADVNAALLADAFAGEEPRSSANAAAIAHAGGILRRYTFRAFDTGALPERGPELVETPEMSLPGAHVTFEMRETNGERWLSVVRATSPSGPLFDKDVSAWRHAKGPGGAGATLIGARLVRVDVAARVLLLIGVYMNVNAYLPAAETVHVTRF